MSLSGTGVVPPGFPQSCETKRLLVLLGNIKWLFRGANFFPLEKTIGDYQATPTLKCVSKRRFAGGGFRPGVNQARPNFSIFGPCGD